MIELLPPYLREYTELKEIMTVEGSEIETINTTHNQLVDNRYIQTCDETGIKRFESMLGITPLMNDTLDDRKFRCITVWNQKLPYNYSVLEAKLKSLCGKDGYEILSDFAAQTVLVKLALTQKNQYDTVAKLIDEILPCNLVTTIRLMYNTHEILGQYTHEQLAQYTHKQLREDVMQ